MDVVNNLLKETAVTEGVLKNTGTPNPSVLSAQLIAKMIPSELSALVDKVNFLIKDDVDRKELKKLAREKGTSAVLTVAIAHALSGKPVEAKPSVKTELADRQKSLFPYLLSQSEKAQGYLVGFENTKGPERDNLWFYALGENAKGIICLGYDGEPRQVDANKLALSGLTKINGDAKSLKQKCRANLPKDLTPEDIVTVNFHVGKSTLPKSTHDQGRRSLSLLVSSLPEVGAKSVLHNKDIPKI
ncbi:MAG: hypothetical protein CBC55_03020 [Gammaproteobacteria bacterium TMED95]|nr:MAG: hypothetical protein CBC55_03020 [Gammaproteobacteria bacterium TMED95]|tara:strand:- start:48308 stop:49039 length:732 start_codon:yes stop_codon:yes gene_type:complete